MLSYLYFIVIAKKHLRKMLLLRNVAYFSDNVEIPMVGCFSVQLVQGFIIFLIVPIMDP